MTARNWAAFRRLLRSTQFGHNAEVYRFFKGIDESKTTTRKSLRDTCLIQANDSINDAKMRVQIFRDLVQQAHLKPDVYGVPMETYKETVDFRPQVWMWFTQDRAAVPEGKPHITAEISFRLMDETPATINETKAKTIAENIAKEFVVAGNGYVFTKGKILLTYKDEALGYRLKVQASTELEGENVFKKVLGIQNHTYDSDKFTNHTPKKNSVNNPVGTEKVYGKDVPKKRYRPTGNVRFRYAVLELCSLHRDIILVDTTGKYRDALVKK